MSLLVHVEFLGMTVKRTVIDEGPATSVMSLACGKGLGAHTLTVPNFGNSKVLWNFVSGFATQNSLRGVGVE